MNGNSFTGIGFKSGEGGIMIRVGVVGATGYAGAELVRILAGHETAELSVLTSRRFAGAEFDKVYPCMSGVVNMVCDELNLSDLCKRTDFVFIALPHKIPMAIVPELIEKGKKVVDLSADFRFSDPTAYEAAYQPHTAKNLLKRAVYGLCEVYSEQIKRADITGNPGCYPTSILLPLIPLVKSSLLDCNTIIADSKSGVSGAGRSLSLTTHFCEVSESFKAYKVASHRHNPEINEVLTMQAQKNVKITFVPHLVPMSRGMLSTIYAKINKNVTSKDIRTCLASFYDDQPFVRICEQGIIPDTSHVRGTNFCDIGFEIDELNNRLILISAIDNLVKGAAGQAVQNMNIMVGLEQTTGLMGPGFPV